MRSFTVQTARTIDVKYPEHRSTESEIMDSMVELADRQYARQRERIRAAARALPRPQPDTERNTLVRFLSENSAPFSMVFGTDVARFGPDGETYQGTPLPPWVHVIPAGMAEYMGQSRPDIWRVLGPFVPDPVALDPVGEAEFALAEEFPGMPDEELVELTEDAEV